MASKIEAKYNLDDFKVEGSNGVIIREVRKNHFHTENTCKRRFKQPEEGDFVGIITHHLLRHIQITCVGRVVSKKGSEKKPIYDIWTVDVDPNEYDFTGTFYYPKLAPRKKPIELGLMEKVEGRLVVPVRGKVLREKKYAAFEFSPEQEEEYQKQVEGTEEREKEERKRKREEKRERKKAKEAKTESS